MLKLGKCLDGEEESDEVIPWTALASSQSKINGIHARISARDFGLFEDAKNPLRN